MESNECGTSLVNVIPRNNNVLLRMEFKASVLDLATGKPSKEAEKEKVKFFVAGFGKAVKDLSLNDEVNIKLEAYENIEVEGNSKSIVSLTDFFSRRNMKPGELDKYIKDSPHVDVVQYGIFPEFICKAIIMHSK